MSKKKKQTSSEKKGKSPKKDKKSLKTITKLKKENKLLSKMLKRAEKQILTLKEKLEEGKNKKQKKGKTKDKKKKAEKQSTPKVEAEAETEEEPEKALVKPLIVKNEVNLESTDTTIVQVQCAGKNKDGSPCKRMTSDPSGLCYQHKNN